MKTSVKLLTLIAVVVSGTAMAAYQDAMYWPGTYQADIGSTPVSPTTAVLRDGSTLVPTGYYALAVWSDDLTADPPTNNPANSYLVVNEVFTEDLANNPTKTMGSENTGVGWWAPEEPGLYDGFIVRNGYDSGNGYLRAFSATHPTNAAYYGSCTPVALTSESEVRDITASATTINIINPVYTGLQFTKIGGTYGAVCYGTGPNYSISGQVANVSAAGGNNIIQQSNLAIYWRTNGDPTWYAVASLAWTGDGGWSGTYPGGSDVMIGMSGGPAVLPNSLGGQGALPVQPIPEPALALVGMVALALLRKVR